MKNKLSEYYKLKDEDLMKHWQEDVFSLDANVLLNLYRYTPATRDAFFSLLDRIKERVWISYQAAFEYQRNRLVVISKQHEAYTEIRLLLENKKNEIENKLNEYKRHPYLQTEELKKQIQSAFDAIGKDISNLEMRHPDYLQDDPIWVKLSDLLDGKIGDDFTSDELDKVFKEGKKRFDEEIPPGYKDKATKKNEGNRSLYGDFIVWSQILKQAKTTKASIIFVTDDRKEDWWYKFKGRTIGPRPELIKEFKVETGKRVNIYQADNFLDLAIKNLNQISSPEAIREIREIRLADEMEIDKERKQMELLLEDKGDDNSKVITKAIFL
jgi:PIN like domain